MKPQDSWKFVGLVFRVYDGNEKDNFYSERVVRVSEDEARKLLEDRDVSDKQRV